MSFAKKYAGLLASLLLVMAGIIFAVYFYREHPGFFDHPQKAIDNALSVLTRPFFSGPKL